MTISELGSLGEFVSSIAVLVTLVYLALQIRLARAEGAAAAIKDRGKDVRELMLTQLSDDVLCGAIVKAGASFDSAFTRPSEALLDAGLTEIEAHKVGMYYAALLHVYMVQHAAIEPRHRRTQDAAIALNFSAGIGRLFWDTDMCKLYSSLAPEFASHVTDVISAHDRAADTKTASLNPESR